MSVDDLKSGKMTGASHSDLSYPLYDFLKSLVPLQAFAVLIIDETQNLSPPLLEEIRILSDLESPEKLLQVVLVGQLELRAKLKLPEMRQLDQRVSARCSLQPLSATAWRDTSRTASSVAGGSRRPRALFAECRRCRVSRVGRHSPRHQSHLRSCAAPRPPLQRKNVIDLEAVAQAIDDLGVGTLTAAPSFGTPCRARRAACASAGLMPVAPTAPALRRVARLRQRPLPSTRATLPLTDIARPLLQTSSGLEVHDIEKRPELAQPFTPIRRCAPTRIDRIRDSAVRAETVALRVSCAGRRRPSVMHSRSCSSRCSEKPCFINYFPTLERV